MEENPVRTCAFQTRGAVPVGSPFSGEMPSKVGPRTWVQSARACPGSAKLPTTQNSAIQDCFMIPTCSLRQQDAGGLQRRLVVDSGDGVHLQAVTERQDPVRSQALGRIEQVVQLGEKRLGAGFGRVKVEMERPGLPGGPRWSGRDRPVD